MEQVKQIEALVDVAVLGKQVDDFMRSDVGQFLTDRINDELNDAYDALKTVDAADAKAVYAAQNAVWRSETLARWIETAIQDGIRATNVLESREDD